MGKTNQQLGDILRDHGLRPTKARCLLLKLLSRKDNHLSTDEIIRALARQGEKVGTATLYQNLDRLAQHGVLARFAGPDGLMRYDSNLSPHYHLICRRCNRIQDIGIDMGLEHRMLQPVSHHTGAAITDWQIDGAHVELRGVCSGCLSGKPAGAV